ncbi:BTAD domain-containing putative transcriptional regulator [Nonomuraea sp. NPDC050540]|uniref:AfsR/SARP family transcriptional regulator n=1 Tax=Nonomuraea sp. NPDC050540 TaxID=3364367 RepID=UPI0037B034B4
MFGLLVMVLAAALITRLRPRLSLAGAGLARGGHRAGGGGDILHDDHGHGEAMPVATAAGTQAPAVEPAEVGLAGAPENPMTDVPASAGQGDAQPVSPVPAADAAMEGAPLGPVGSGFVVAAGKTKVEVFGVPRVTWAGAEVSFGRAEARDLFALLSVSPDGVSMEAIVEALWPGDGERGGRRLESAVREINQAMRHATQRPAGVRFVVKSGERRLLPAASFDVDFWRFGDACQRASTTTDDVTRTAALQEAVSLYRGSLLAGRDDLWILPVRQAAQRQGVNAAVRLAELLRADDPERAVDVLQLAVERIDPYNETLWCQLMAVQNELRRPTAVRRSFELLKERLAEIDAAPSAQARQVYEQLLR